MPSRNILLTFFLVLFFLGYGSYWAYQTQYLAPRTKLNDEITKLSTEIEAGKNNLAAMTQFCSQNQGFYYRSLPRIQNDARSLYSFWLLELLQYTGFDKNNVNDQPPARLAFGYDYRFTIQSTGTLAQLSNFLFEFYYAPFLHRIASLTVTPVDADTELLTFSMTVSALYLYPRQVNDPYPMVNQLPSGMIPRLLAKDLSPYQVIADRNLLQAAKGGIDKADHTMLTAILQIDSQKEVWFSVRTDDSIIKAKLGDPINAGSFSGKIVEILEEDIVLERNGERWLLTTGESLNEAFALPPETVP